jgi:hypothetical protein
MKPIAISRLFILVLLSALTLWCQLSGQSQSTSNPSAQPQGSHMIRNQKYQLMLRPRDASRKDGAPIVLYPYQPWKCMAWRFESLPGGVRLMNYFTGKTFESWNQSASDVPLIQMPSAPEPAAKQTWKFVSIGGGLYRIESHAGGDVLTAIDPEGSGDIRVNLSLWKGLDSQKWQLLDLPDRFTM